MPTHHRLIIIGSGPAGYTASIYAARANLASVLITGQEQGGQLTKTTDVENWPGDHQDLQGPELMQRMLAHSQKVGAEVIFDHIGSVDFSSRPFTLVGDEGTYTADAVIIATGASAKYLGLPSEQSYMGKGVSACATCDGFFFKDKKVLVVGGGDSAMEEANYLTKFASEVVIVHRRDEFRASKIMIDRAMNNPKIRVLWNSSVQDIFGSQEKGVHAVKIKKTDSDESFEEDCDGIFMAIGHKPNTDLFNDLLDMDENGYLVTKNDSTLTNIDGIFACGDVQDHVYRQAITAAGSGCMSAIDAERYLESSSE